MRKAVASRQLSVVSKRRPDGRISRASFRYACLFFLVLTGYWLLTTDYCFAQGRMYDGSAPLYSPRPELDQGTSGLPSALREVKIEQRLNEQVPLDLKFKDETGREVRLGDYLNGTRPAVLALVFYKCPMLCDQILVGVVGSARSIPFDAGKEYDVIVVSFDPREKPEDAAEKKRSYTERYNRPGTEKGWHFLTGDPENIKRLTDAVGFRYNYDEKTNQFAHAAGIMVLTPGGKLSRYFYRVEYDPTALRLSLVEASGNKIGSLTDQLLLYCYHYDPATGRYGPAVMKIMRLGGVLTMLGVVALILILRRRGRQARAAAGAGEPAKAQAG